jgi:hypothetical protein
MIILESNRAYNLHFLHTLTAFNMKTETFSFFNVLDFVPIVNQSLVYLNTGNKEGILVALEGYCI